MARRGLPIFRVTRLATLANRARSPRRRFDEGFTLVELLIVVTILPVVVGAISIGLISVLSLQANATSRVSDSSDAQIVASTFVKDVQSARGLTTGPTSQCGPTSSGVVQLLGLRWSGNSTVVSYDSVAVANGANTTYSLVRDYCTLNSSVPSRVSVIAHDLPSGQAVPTINPPNGAASTGWISTAGILGVKLMVTAPQSKFSYSLTGTPRAWTATSGALSSGATPYAPITLLCGNSCATSGLSVGNGTVSINVGSGTGNGALAVNSPNPGSISVANNGSLLASSILTTNQSLNSIASNTHATYPGTEYYGSSFPDPLASLVPPVPNGSPVICTQSESTYTCPAGDYVNNLWFPPNSTVNFTGGGTYWFEQGLALPNGVDATFSSAIYIFDGTTALSTGSTSNGTISGSNVLFYIRSGSATFSNNGSVSLTPMSGYDGVTVWDAVIGGTLTLSNNSSTNSYGGLYVPNGTISVSPNATIGATFFVASSASFANGVNVTIAAP